MKRTVLILACVFALASMVFAVLPLGTLALLPIVPALVLGFIAYRNCDGVCMHMARLTMIVAGVMLLIVIGKEFLLKDTVDKDTQFEQKKIESEKEAKNELESEGL